MGLAIDGASVAPSGSKAVGASPSITGRTGVSPWGERFCFSGRLAIDGARVAPSGSQAVGASPSITGRTGVSPWGERFCFSGRLAIDGASVAPSGSKAVGASPSITGRTCGKARACGDNAFASRDGLFAESKGRSEGQG